MNNNLMLIRWRTIILPGLANILDVTYAIGIGICLSVHSAVYPSICPPITLSWCPHISRHIVQGIDLKFVEYIHHGNQQIWVTFGHALQHPSHFLAPDLSTWGQSPAYAVSTSRMVVISYAWLHLGSLGNKTSGVKWGKLPAQNS